MTRNQIIGLAREAGMKASIGPTDRNGKYHPDVNALGKYVPVEWLEAFASQVAAAEREACAALHDHEDVLQSSAWGEAYQEGWANGTAAYRDTIRAQKTP